MTNKESLPTEMGIDPLEEELDFHERFMESRLRVYVGREQVNKHLIEFAEGNDTLPCLVTGPGGAGKSAILSRLVTDFRRKHPQALLIPHFIGASSTSTSLRDMLRRFCLILKGTFGFYQEVSEEMAGLITTFRSFIFQVPEDTRILIVIDALNQLDKADSAHELAWLPEELPQNVKVVISCASDGTMDEPVLEAMKRRQVHSIEVPPLSDDERRKIIRKVPSLSAKTLDEEQVDLLLDNPATINPLYLQVALEELRGFGVYEQLNERIASFPRDGEVVTAIFIQVVERLEEDFGQGLVRTLLSMLASARRGLSEQEQKSRTVITGKAK